MEIRSGVCRTDTEPRRGVCRWSIVLIAIGDSSLHEFLAADTRPKSAVCRKSEVVRGDDNENQLVEGLNQRDKIDEAMAEGGCSDERIC